MWMGGLVHDQLSPSILGDRVQDREIRLFHVFHDKYPALPSTSADRRPRTMLPHDTHQTGKLSSFLASVSRILCIYTMAGERR